jgi:secreted trypsin-like serine protease
MKYPHIISIMACAFLSLDIVVSSPLQIDKEEASHSQTDERALKDRIIGGKVANAKRYPYFTSLDIYFESGLTTYCGGSLVHSDIVMTVASCLIPYESNDTIVEIQVYVNYTQSIEVTGYLTGFEHERLGIAYIMHLDFDDVNYFNDIGLVYLDSPINDVKPVKLNMNGNIPSASNTLTVMGHGTISNAATSEYPDYLMETSLPIVSFQDCNDSNSYNGAILNPTMICAGASGKGACIGDAGGPLIIRGNTAIKDVQVGILSWGQDCGMANYPDVYTRVSAYSQWVQNYICLYSKVKPLSCSNGVKPSQRPVAKPPTKRPIGKQPSKSPTKFILTPFPTIKRPSKVPSPTTGTCNHDLKCQRGEDCVSCPRDCNGKFKGFCCVGGFCANTKCNSGRWICTK